MAQPRLLRLHARHGIGLAVHHRRLACPARRTASAAGVPGDVPDSPVPTPDIDGRLDLTAALGRLAARERDAVDLPYFAGLSVTETATVMGCSPGTLKSSLSDARTWLRRRHVVKVCQCDTA